MITLSEKVADSQYDALSSSELSMLLNDAEGVESTPTTINYSVNAKQILSVLGATNGAIFLDALELVAATNSAVKWTLIFLKTESGINVGDAETRNSLDQLVALGVLSASSVMTIKAMADSSISWAQANRVRVDGAAIQVLRGEV